MRIALRSPTRDPGECSIKEREGLKYYGEEVGWGGAPAAVPEGTSFPRILGDIVPTQSKISCYSDETIP